ncbi:vacuolar protein sorting-associated protein 4B-like [Haemaphysalis longicornis]
MAEPRGAAGAAAAQSNDASPERTVIAQTPNMSRQVIGTAVRMVTVVEGEPITAQEHGDTVGWLPCRRRKFGQALQQFQRDAKSPHHLSTTVNDTATFNKGKTAKGNDVQASVRVLRLAGLVPNRSGRHRSRSPDRKPVRKVLLYGPSATGKTCLTSAIVARCADATVYYVSTPVLLHRCRLRGDVVLLHTLFDDALRRIPCVLCFDDLDALCSLPKSPRDQERLRALKCAWLERVGRLPAASTKGGVLVLGVINNPWLLDDDVRSQFERILFAPLPHEADRLRLLKQLVRSPALTDEDYRHLAKRTEGFTSTFLSMLAADALRNARAVCEHAYDRAIDADALKVTLSDVLTSMDKVELPESVSRRSSSGTASKTESVLTSP